MGANSEFSLTVKNTHEGSSSTKSFSSGLSPSTTRHTRTTPSSPPVARYWPSELNFMVTIAPSCALMTWPLYTADNSFDRFLYSLTLTLSTFPDILRQELEDVDFISSSSSSASTTQAPMPSLRSHPSLLFLLLLLITVFSRVEGSSVSSTRCISSRMKGDEPKVCSNSATVTVRLDRLSLRLWKLPSLPISSTTNTVPSSKFLKTHSNSSSVPAPPSPEAVGSPPLHAKLGAAENNSPLGLAGRISSVASGLEHGSSSGRAP
uniref:Uncharacterized protein n=1 Tax=Arundo donax TaxID=35708 RepID=A0A0A9EII9_ARUDO